MTSLGLDPRVLERERGRAHLALGEAARALASGTEASWLAVGDAAAVYTWAGAPFNQVLGLGWSEDPPEPQLDALEAFFRVRGAACVIDLADQAPSVWRDLLCARGYRLRESLYLWARPLVAADAAAADPRVARVRDEAGRDGWVRAVAGGFLDAREATEGDLDIARAVAASPGTELFVARDGDGIAVAGGAVQVVSDIACLFSASTLPRARRQGFQAGLIRARMAWAMTRGARVATIQTEPTGASRRNVERLGFRVAYTSWTLASPPL